MVHVFYSQKTEQILQKFELTYWRPLVQKKLEQKHQDLSDNWKNCAIGKEKVLEIITKIEQYLLIGETRIKNGIKSRKFIHR